MRDASVRSDGIGVAVIIGLGAAVVAFAMASRPKVTPDLVYYWRAARLFLAGVNPYTVPLNSPQWPRPDPLFYPLPAILLTAPLAALKLPFAAAIFSGFPIGLLAWHRLRTGAFWSLLALAHPGVVMAVVLGQWSPWLMVAIAWPALGCFLAAKPTLGAACWIGRPSFPAVVSGLAILLLSLIVAPYWPADWLHNLSQVQGHPAPILTALGGVCVLAAVRWRDPDARLVLAFACVPQLLFFADQAPLVTTAKTKGETVWLVVTGWIAWVWWHQRYYGQPDGYVPAAVPFVLVGCFWPVVSIILWRAWRGREVVAELERA
jgi:hypothetical protein